MKKITALLGLSALPMHNNIFGTGKNFAKLDEEQLQTIEDALGAEPDPENATKIENLTNQVSTLTESATGIQEAVTSALEMNGLTLEEGKTVADAVALLGAKCKEYGEAKTTHTIPPTDGKQKSDTGTELIDGYMDPNDEHNKHLNK